MEKKKFITIKNGNTVEYNVVIEFTSKDNNKKYVAYTNDEKDENGNTKVFLATYEVDTNNNDLYILTPIETQEEIDMFSNLLKDFAK